MDLAIAGLGGGTVSELKNRIFSNFIKVFPPEYRAYAIASLPYSIRASRMAEGTLWRRVEQTARPVLHLHGRTRDMEIFLFDNEVPKASVWRGCILLLSRGLAEVLSGDQLAGIVAHELGHAYFMEELSDARQRQDEGTMRTVELKCDAVASLSLTLLGRDPGAYLGGLRLMHHIFDRLGLSVSQGRTHPTMAERAQFFDRLWDAIKKYPPQPSLSARATSSIAANNCSRCPSSFDWR